MLGGFKHEPEFHIPRHLRTLARTRNRWSGVYALCTRRADQRFDGGGGSVWFHDLVDSMSQDIVDTCSGGVHGSCPLCR